MWKIADSPFPFSLYTGASENQDTVGVIFLRSVFGYLILVCKEMETKGRCLKNKLCCL